jgi:hypothetical protein
MFWVDFFLDGNGLEVLSPAPCKLSHPILEQ